MTIGHKFLTRISHYLRRGTGQVKHSRSITINNVGRANIVGRKPIDALIPSVIPACSLASDSAKSDTSPPNAPIDDIRSLDKTHKHVQTSTTSRAFQALRRRRLMGHQQQHDHSHFIAARTAAESNNNGNDNVNATESVLESSRTTFREADCDSISSTSSLEILVQ